MRFDGTWMKIFDTKSFDGSSSGKSSVALSTLPTVTQINFQKVDTLTLTFVDRKSVSKLQW